MSDVESRRNRLRHAPLWVHALAWCAFAVVVAVSIWAYQVYGEDDVWARWLTEENSAARWPTGQETHFGERIYGASIYRTPSNALSNLAYVLVGFYILAYALHDLLRRTSPRDPYAVRNPALMFYFGYACVLLGWGSWFMHASLTGTGGWYDVYAMFGSLIAIIALHVARWIPHVPLGKFRMPSWPLLLLAAFFTNYLVMEQFGRFSDIQIMTGLISTIILCVCIDLVRRRSSMQHRWYLLSALSFAVAFAIWLLTNAQRFTSPDVWLQGHAIWHVLTACSLGYMAILYRSEVPLSVAVQERKGALNALDGSPAQAVSSAQ